MLLIGSAVPSFADAKVALLSISTSVEELFPMTLISSFPTVEFPPPCDPSDVSIADGSSNVNEVLDIPATVLSESCTSGSVSSVVL